MDFIKIVTFLRNNIFSIITAIVGIFGAYITYKQWVAEHQFARLNKVYELVDKTRTDDEIKHIISYIGRDNITHTITYNDGHFNVDDNKEGRTADFKKHINTVLAIYAHICQLYFEKILDKNDIRPFEYVLQRIADSKAVSNYLYSLYHHAKANGTEMSFIYLVEYCLKQKYLAADFTCPNSDNYEYHLEKNAKYKKYLAKHNHEHCK